MSPFFQSAVMAAAAAIVTLYLAASLISLWVLP